MGFIDSAIPATKVTQVFLIILASAVLMHFTTEKKDWVGPMDTFFDKVSRTGRSVPCRRLVDNKAAALYVL